MIIGSLIELVDTRIAISPESAKLYIDSGFSVFLEEGYGSHIFAKEEYLNVGVVFTSKEKIFDVDIFLQVHCPEKKDYEKLQDCILICFLNPFFSFAHLNILKKNNVTCFSMELVPRSSFAQKMDALSSQANLSGYVSVILAAQKLSKVLPMMITPAGTIRPSKFLVIGTGVAGLQAIATAKRLGAQVSAYDTRDVAKEQVESLGAKFLEMDLLTKGQTDQGYAKELTDEQLSKQQEILTKECIASDVIITTAQIFAKKAPIIIRKNIIEKMKKGSVIVDCAVDTGGNVEGVQINKEISFSNVCLMGYSHLAQHVCTHASQVYSKNIQEFLFECFDNKKENLLINFQHDIVKSMLVIYQNEIVHPLILEKMK